MAVATILFVCVASTANAQQCMGRAAVFYVNGVDNTLAEADLSRLRLQEALSTYLGPTCVVPPVFLALNQSSGAIVDSGQAVLQYVHHVGSDDIDLRTHLVQYRSALQANYHVILVAHSQGNFYANAAYDELAGELGDSIATRFSIISVATPDSRVGDGVSPYVTLANDVIRRVPGSLSESPNLNAICGSEFECHSFVGSYMHEDQPRDLILSYVVADEPLPRPTDDFYMATRGTDLVVQSPGVLSNDTFPALNVNFQLDTLGQPFGSTNLVDMGNGGFMFLLSLVPQFSGLVSFDYTVDTRYGLTLPAKITINVSNQVPPVATCIPPPPGLVSWWPGDGNSMDLLGGNPGTLEGSGGFAPGKVGQAFSFDGSGFVRVPSATNLNISGSLTIDALIFPTSDALSRIVGKWGDAPSWGGQRVYSLDMNSDGRLIFAVSDDAHQDDHAFHDFQSPPNLVTLNAWSHVAGVYDQSTGTRRLYVNGVEVAQRTDPPITLTTSVADLGIGATLNAPGVFSYPFHGEIDEVHVFNRALTQSQIQAIFDAGNAGYCKTPITWPPRYTIANLGSLGGSSSQANAVNATGQVAGTSGTTPPGETSHPFLWSNGVMQDLSATAGPAEGRGLNDNGLVVGLDSPGDGHNHPMRWSGTTPTDLGLFAGDFDGTANGINASDHVARLLDRWRLTEIRCFSGSSWLSPPAVASITPRCLSHISATSMPISFGARRT